MGERLMDRMNIYFYLFCPNCLGPMICADSGARRSMRKAKFGMPTRANNSMRFKLKASFPKPLQGAPESVWALLSIAEKAIVNVPP